MRLARGSLVTRRLVVAMGMALLVGISHAEASDDLDATPIGVDTRISGDGATSSEEYPAMVWNQTANEYLVVWVDHRTSATRGRDIYGRRVGANGVAIGADFRISASNTHEYRPAVAWNATTNEYLVVWDDDRTKGSRGYEIYGRRVNASGVMVGTSFRVSNSTESEFEPAVVWSVAANQYLVVWGDDRSRGTRGDEIYGRRVGADGAVLGTADIRVSNSLSDEASPAAAWSPAASQYLVVWTDERSTATRGTEIYGRRLDAAGIPVGGNFRVSGSISGEYDPAVAWNQTTAQYLVVWKDTRSVGTRGYEIYGRRVSAAGVRVGGDLRISDSIFYEHNPAVVWNQTANQYLVVWDDERNKGTRGKEIYGRRVNANGAVAGTSFLISGSTSHESRPAVAWNATANQYLVVWEDSRSSATRGYEIYGRRVTGD